ncbi:MAG: hypothetical protein J6Q65_01345, partial [Lentisphaeria bacterium]|nr:hypothetical protein [Lentisphaeria bacterium]
IRCDEVKDALNWILVRMKDLSGFDHGSDEIRLAALNTDTDAGRAMFDAIRTALNNLGCPEAESISLAQISDNEKIVSAALQNGDGVIPPDPVGDALTADCIRAIMKLVGKVKDLSGAEGVDKAAVDSFEKQAAGYLAWRDEYNADPAKFLPCGDKTAALHGAISAIADKTDAFFRSAATLRFGNLTRGGTGALVYDPLEPETVSSFLEKSPIANPAETSELINGSDTVNPLWRDRVGAFFDALSAAEGKTVEKITAGEWASLKAKIATYGGWIGRKNTAIFDGFDENLLRSFAEQKVYDTIRTLIANDVAVSNDLVHCKDVRKLILFQKYMLDFLNNFVCLHNLFSPELPSMIQMGKLVMDGRVFTLCTLVPNLAEHKKIVMESDICVMYIDAVRKTPTENKTMKLAVAVTSGHVRNIFVGKSGIFYTEDGAVWDAKVFDFVKQPVSVSEAIREPFYKFADFLQKQAEKYIATKSKTYETNVANNIQAQAKPAPAPAAPVTGPMMLMGGGIGIAAIGSAFAFMAKSLQGISFSTVLAVLLGIMLIFGGPIILVSLVKLFNRNLSRFFEANGYAINMKMRLSLKMGRFFTYEPGVPFSMLVMPEKFSKIFTAPRKGMPGWVKVILWILVLLVLAVGFIYWQYPCTFDRIFGIDRAEKVTVEQTVPEKKDCKEAAKPEPAKADCKDATKTAPAAAKSAATP